MAVILLLHTGCGVTPAPVTDPFSASPIPIDGNARLLSSRFVNLGSLNAGQVVRINGAGTGVSAVLILRRDSAVPEAGDLVGGGKPAKAFDYRIPSDGVYAVLFLFEADAPVVSPDARIAVAEGDPSFRPPREQFVQVVFSPGYLSEPGLFDPESMTADDQQLLAGLADPVQQSILAELHRIFDGTPVRILSETDPLPAAPVSRLTYLPDRVVSTDPSTIDAALPAPDATRPECQVSTTYGEVLPNGIDADPGNQVRDDQAVVFVGSFQGRGATCQSAAINSLNNLTLSLAQSGAHEIGHLVGLVHVTQIDIMNPTATLAFLRELPLARGQIRQDTLEGQQLVGAVLSNVIQDPEIYFRTAFDNGR